MNPKLVLVLALGATTAGCDDPLKSVDRIAEPRVLAARVEVDGAPERASPYPGETVHVSWLVATPTGDAFAGLALFACPTRAQGRGLLTCHSPVIASASTPPESQRPSFDFSVPSELDPQRTPELLVQGQLCPDATGTVDGEQTRCSSDGGLRVSVDFPLATAEQQNTNPSLAPDALSFDGAPFPAASGAGGACQGTGLLEIAATRGDHAITVTLPASARDELPQATPTDSPREALEIAHFVSAGELDHVFTRLLPEATELGSVVRFTPPADVADGGTLVHFWFVVRDGRGGSDFTERSVCVLP